MPASAPFSETRFLQTKKDKAIGKTISGKYKIIQKMGKGGMGDVYEAVDQKLKRTVALKFLSPKLRGDPEARDLFIREAQAASALDHPNICTIYEVDETEDKRMFISMAYYRGETLRQKIDKHALGLAETVDIAIAVARGLAKAHAAEIVHSDIKPANIFVTDDGQVKILDFGLAKLAGERRRMSGIPAGTVLYMSPEQVQGKDVDQRSDVWSLGVVLYEMLTGKAPFTGRTASQVVDSIVNAEPKPVRSIRPETPIELERIVSKALSKGVQSRYQKVADLLTNLTMMTAELGARPRDGESSIAVLPFVDMSSKRDQEYFCEGIAEELINSLGKICCIQVASRTSAFKYKDSNLDIREIGQQLNVKTVLEGSVRKDGDTLRVTAQLINVADGYHLWSERYDREMKDVFAIQDEIAQSIVDALKVTLTPKERRSVQATGTRQIEAYDDYLRGRNFYYQFRRKSIELALQMFTLAIEHDPNYAHAYAGIADCYSYLFLYAERSSASLRKAAEASHKALELNPELAEAHASRGQVLSLSKKHSEAEAEFENAIRLGPRLFQAYYLYARDSFAQGKSDKAVELYEKAMEVSPDDYQAPLLVSQVYEDLGQESKAAAARRRAVKIVQEHLKVDPGDVRALYMGANGLIGLGETEKGIEWAALALIIDPTDPMLLYNVGCIYSMAGRIEEALACLEKATSAGLSQKEWYEHDSNLDPLRNHPRFKALLAELK